MVGKRTTHVCEVQQCTATECELLLAYETQKEISRNGKGSFLFSPPNRLCRSHGPRHTCEKYLISDDFSLIPENLAFSGI